MSGVSSEKTSQHIVLQSYPVQGRLAKDGGRRGGESVQVLALLAVGGKLITDGQWEWTTQRGPMGSKGPLDRIKGGLPICR